MWGGDVALRLVTVSGGVRLRGVGDLLYLFGLEVSFFFHFLSDCDDRETTSPIAFESESKDESSEEVSCFLFLDVAFFFFWRISSPSNQYSNKETPLEGLLKKKDKIFHLLTGTKIPATHFLKRMDLQFFKFYLK